MAHPSKIENPVKAGDSGKGPLAGIRVLDLSAYIAGPYGCSLLADLGADVIKVEPPAGDNMRNYPSTLDAECRLFLGVNRGKRSIVIDLKQTEGLTLLKSLLVEVDVLVHNFRPGVAERLGIGYGDLALLQPRLIYAGLSGYGESGPLRTRAGFDQVLQTMTGICVGQAAPGAAPEIVYGSVVDYFASSMLALGLTAALYSRERTGCGQRLNVSLLGAALCSQSGRFIWAESEGADVDRHTRSTGVNAIFPTKLGHIYLSATAPHFWTALCKLLGCDDMAEDKRYDSLAKRLQCKVEITQRITDALASRTAVEWDAVLSGQVPCAVAQPIEAMFDHPQVLAEEHVATYEHPGVGTYRGFRTPIHFEGTPLAQPRSAPALGQHTHEVLMEAGLSATGIGTLQQAGIVIAASN